MVYPPPSAPKSSPPLTNPTPCLFSLFLQNKHAKIKRILTRKKAQETHMYNFKWMMKQLVLKYKLILITV